MKEFFENFLMPTKTIYSMWVIMAVILLFSIIATRKMKDVPGPLQNIAEMAVGGLLNFFAGVWERRRHGTISRCWAHSLSLSSCVTIPDLFPDREICSRSLHRC